MTMQITMHWCISPLVLLTTFLLYITLNTHYLLSILSCCSSFRQFKELELNVFQIDQFTFSVEVKSCDTVQTQKAQQFTNRDIRCLWFTVPFTHSIYKSNSVRSCVCAVHTYCTVWFTTYVSSQLSFVALYSVLREKKFPSKLWI